MMKTLNSHVPDITLDVIHHEYEGLAVQHESILNTTPEAQAAPSIEGRGSTLCFSDIAEGEMNVYLLPCKSATINIWVLPPPSQLLFNFSLSIFQNHYWKTQYSAIYDKET